MVTCCIAKGCNSAYPNPYGKSSIVFHRFPLKDPARMIEWLKVCKPGFDPSNTTGKTYYRLCSKHFHRDQYMNANDRKNLIRSAVPFLPRSCAKKTETPKTSKQPLANQKSVNQTVSGFPRWMEDDDLPKTSKPIETPNSKKTVEEEEDVTVEVIMNDVEVVKGRSNPSTTNQSLILENIELKTKNQELINQLKTHKQRLALMEGHVHRLSNLVGRNVECVCALCTDFSLN